MKRGTCSWHWSCIRTGTQWVCLQLNLPWQLKIAIGNVEPLTQFSTNTEKNILYIVNCDFFRVCLPDTIARFEYIGCIFQDHLFSWILACRIHLPECKAPKLTQRPCFFCWKQWFYVKATEKMCLQNENYKCILYSGKVGFESINIINSGLNVFDWGGLQQRCQNLWQKIPPSWRGWKRHLRRWVRYHGWWCGRNFCFPSELILSSSGSGQKILRFVCLLLCMFFKDQDDIHEKKVSGIKR